VERFYLNLDDIEVREEYQVEISNRFPALESLDEILVLIVTGKVLEIIPRPQPNNP
jgi:hypothetical protein